MQEPHHHHNLRTMTKHNEGKCSPVNSHRIKCTENKMANTVGQITCKDRVKQRSIVSVNAMHMKENYKYL